MKRKLLPLVIAGLASGYVAADVTVYGKVNVSANAMDTEDQFGVEEDTHTEINSNASRIGFKGGYKLGEGSAKAIFKLEYEVNVDDGTNADVFKQRNIYGGFTGDWGTLVAGNHDTPLKMAQGKVDRFNDLELGDMKNVLVGEDREPNLVMYTTPSMGGVSATFAYQTGDSDEQDGAQNAGSAVVQYEAGDLRLAVAYNAGVNHTDTTRVVAEYNGSGFKVGALYQMAEEEDAAAGISSVKGPAGEYGLSFEEQTAFLVSGEVAVAKNVKLKAQYAMSESDVVGGAASVDATQYAVGADYKLNDQSKLYAYYAAIDGEPDTAGAPDQTDATVGVGYEIKF